MSPSKADMTEHITDYCSSIGIGTYNTRKMESWIMLCSLIQINPHIAERLANLIIDKGDTITPETFLHIVWTP